MLLIILYETYIFLDWFSYQYIPSIDHPRVATLFRNISFEARSHGPSH